jgi:(4-(4-[2-(gamma-L-glutamylamino)ethyl]phenoxymethyl)furan-2-yl)methanamine synthase
MSKREACSMNDYMNWLALDIGGANVKTADGRGYAQSYAFALWRDSLLLAQQIRTAISEAPPCDHLAVTMTGELADCFESKAAGIRFILEAVKAGSDNRHARVYLSDGRLVSPQVALTAPHLAAASNWHALARFAGRFAPTGPALLIDVGSTTCDVIPLMDGKPVAKGATDTQRLLSGELVYTGVERSPLCAVVSLVPYRGQSCPVVHEVFATMRDAYMILDQLPDDPANMHTPDGKPATRPFARVRLGRMIAADTQEFNHRDAVALAQSAADAQVSRLAAAVRQVCGTLPRPPEKIVLSGHGEFLALEAMEFSQITAPVVSLATELGQSVSRSGPAHALAVLARESTSK